MTEKDGEDAVNGGRSQVRREGGRTVAGRDVGRLAKSRSRSPCRPELGSIAPIHTLIYKSVLPFFLLFASMPLLV